MKGKLLETKFESVIPGVGGLFCRLACFGAVILICSDAAAQNLFVSGQMPPKNCPSGCGAIYGFTWDGRQSIYAAGLTNPWDVAFDNAGNLFVVDQERSGLAGDATIYKITPSGARTMFARGMSYPSYLTADSAGNLFVADYNQGVIYEYKPTGLRSTFAAGLYHPVGMAVDRSGNLFVADNSIGNIRQGSIYQYTPAGSRTTFAILNPGDRPTDLAFDPFGNLLMADLDGKIFKYFMTTPLKPHNPIVFGSVPGSAQSLAFDSAGNLLVVAGAVDSTPLGTAASNAIYKFTPQGVRSSFASAQELGQTFACLAFRQMACCEENYPTSIATPTPRPRPTPAPRP